MSGELPQSTVCLPTPEPILPAYTRYRQLFEGTSDGILVIDAVCGQLIDANAVGAAWLGYSHDELLGKQLWEIGVLADLETSLAALQELREVGHLTYEELSLTTKSGQRRPVKFSSSLYEENGRQIIQGIMRDSRTGETREQQLRMYEQVLDVVGQAVVVTGPDELVTYWNACAETLYGWSSTDALGRNIHDVTPVATTDAQAVERLACLVKGETWSGEITIGRRGGTTFPAFVRDTAVMDATGNVASIIRLSVDLSEPNAAADAAQKREAEQRELITQLETERAQLVAAQAVAKTGSWETDLVTHQVTWSAEMLRIFEAAPEVSEATVQAFVEMVHPEDRATVDNALARSVGQGDAGAITHRVIMRDGRIKFVEERWQVVEGDDGKLARAIGTCRDITEAKSAEEELDRFFTLSLDILCVIGPQGDFTRLNPAIETVLGFSRDELMAEPFINFVHPDDVAATLREAEELLAGATTRDFENRYRCRDGSYRWLTWTAAAFNGSIYCAAHDITAVRLAEAALHKANDELELHVVERTAELRLANIKLQAEMVERWQTEDSLYKSHEFLEAVLENTAEGIVACDADGQLNFFNRAIREFHGLPSERIQGSQWSRYYVSYLPDGITKIDAQDAPLARALAGEHVRNMELVVVPDAGIPRFLVANGEPLFDATGRKIGAVVVMHDSTERKEAELALQRAKKESDSANLSKSEFLSRMSHELRTPLNAILGFGQILEKEDLTLLQQESVGFVLKGGRHLLNLVNEVLDLARVEAVGFEVALEPIALNDVVPEVCALVRPLAMERNISLEEDLSTVGQCYIMSDRQRLKQVLINLLSNAIKYNRPGGNVTVSCTPVPTDRIRIAVRDTGPGIAIDDFPKLFAPFERLGAVNSTIEGTGLGLSLSQGLTAALGGTLEVQSVVGAGSTFFIDLPQAAPPEELSVIGPVEPLEVVRRVHVPGQYSVLCIEDNVSNLRLLEIILSRRPDVTLLPAMQGSVGLDFARQHEPDVILLDVHLPDMSGIEVLTRLRRSDITKNIPVIIISADATSPHVQQLLETGATAYLTKPLDVRHFMGMLDELLQGLEATRKTGLNEG